MRPDRASNVEDWEIDALVVVLLRQFKRLLADKAVILTDADMQTLGFCVVERTLTDETTSPIREALDALITDSIGVLHQWGLTFAQSLATDMNDLTSLWETTADFLALANEKGNAEIRISAGSALHTLLGGKDYVDHLITTIDHDLRVLGTLDVDAMICKRALTHCANIPQNDADWWERARVWVESLRK